MRDCLSCKQCNRKGKPSVTKNSMYCDLHYIGIKRNLKSGLFRKIMLRFTNFKNIKETMFNKRFDEKKGLNKKGFRERWFN
jgi:hypothetical protein